MSLATSRRFFAVTLLVSSFVLASWAESADARSPERVFAGKIITSKKRLPTSAKSAGKYISKLKKAKATRFKEDKEKKRWKIYFAAFFKRPLNDLEYTIRIYDLGERPRRLLASFEQYTDKRGTKSVISKLILEREQFGVNKQLLMTVENKGKVLSSTKFMILGEAEKYSGQVDFTEEETKGP